MRRLLGLVDRFLADRRARGYAPRSMDNQGSALRALVSWLEEQGITTAADVTAATLAAYQTHLMVRGGREGRPLALGTLANRVAAIRSFFRDAARRGWVLVNPAQDLAVHTGPRRSPAHVLDVDAMRRLLEAPDTTTPMGIRDRAMLELFYSTGLRVTELAALDIADIDLTAGELVVRRGKGGKSRCVPVGAAACLWTRRYLEAARPGLVRRPSEPALFLSMRGRRMDRPNLSRIVRTHAKAAGLRTRVTPHAIRHAFATHMLRGKASLRHLQEMLGHASLTTTQVYTKLDIADLKAVHRRCHPRGRE